MFRVVDKQGRFRSRMLHKEYSNAVVYKRKLEKKYPEYDWMIVKVINAKEGK